MMVHPADEDTSTLQPGVDRPGRGVPRQDGPRRPPPLEGATALDAFVLAYTNISALVSTSTHRQDPLQSSPRREAPTSSRLHRSEWYVRSATIARLEVFRERVMDCFRARRPPRGCTVEVTPVGHVYEDWSATPLLAALFDANSRALGRTLIPGSQRDRPPRLHDMGNVSHVVPSIHPFLDLTAPPVTNHQKESPDRTLTPDGHRALRDGALAMARTVIDLALADRWGELRKRPEGDGHRGRRVFGAPGRRCEEPESRPKGERPGDRVRGSRWPTTHPAADWPWCTPPWGLLPGRGERLAPEIREAGGHAAPGWQCSLHGWAPARSSST